MGKHTLRAAALAALGLGSTALFAAEPATDGAGSRDLQSQIDSLESKVNELRQVQSQQVKATVSDVLHDADQRSQLLQMEGMTGGWTNGKFILSSSDGNFLLHPYLQFQFRTTTTYRENGKSGGDDSDTQNGFEVRRMKVGFDGNAFTPDLTYQFQWAVDRKSGSTNLEDAWVRYKFADDWSVRAGQIKDPMAHESIMSSKRLMAADRALVNDTFSPGDNYTQGVTLIYDAKGPLRFEGGFTDGKNTPNQNFVDFPANTFDWGVAGRVEYNVMGDWKNYDDYTAMGDTKDLLVIGAGADYSEAGNTDVFTHTVDAQYENTSGLGLYAAYYGRSTKNNPAGVTVPPAAPAAEHDLYDWGFILQASYMMNPKLEPFVRYGYLRFDSDGIPAGSEDTVHEITAGVNYYMQGHNAKITFDVGYLPNGSPVADDGAGILINSDNEFYVRGQFQLLL